MEAAEGSEKMRLPSRNVRVFIYGNLAGIAGWWQYVTSNGMDQFALGSLQAFIGALSAAYMMRHDDDKPARRTGKAQKMETRNMEEELERKRQLRGRPMRHSDGAWADPSESFKNEESPLEPAFPHIPREPRVPASRPMAAPSPWRPPEETLPLPPLQPTREVYE